MDLRSKKKNFYLPKILSTDTIEDKVDAKIGNEEQMENVLQDNCCFTVVLRTRLQ